MACYLVYYLRVRSNDALRYVRLKRPNAVQTRKQIDCVKEFEAFFLPQCVIFRWGKHTGTLRGQVRLCWHHFLKMFCCRNSRLVLAARLDVMQKDRK